jgi:predicted O-methyltransferase YrrM
MTKKHWTPRYILDRAILKLYEVSHPNSPWWTKEVIQIMDRVLKKSDNVLEFGSGRSSIWLANRCNHVTTVEHDIIWAEKVKNLARERGVQITVIVPEIRSNIWSEDNQESGLYAEHQNVRGNKFDVIVIDGLFRGSCAKSALELLSPNGVILVDNVNWYLPSDSRSPTSIPGIGAPITSEWQYFYEQTISWRRILTTNGITDSAIYFA